MVEVTVKGNKISIEDGATLIDLAKKSCPDTYSDIMLAKVNGKLSEMNKEVKDGSEVEFLCTCSEDGYKTYTRGMIFVLIKAFFDEIGRENIDRFQVEFSLGAGYYCEYKGKVELDENVLAAVEKKMGAIVDRKSVV